MTKNSNFEQTLELAHKALAHLKANVAPAYPRNYELWYTFAAGFNRDLNKSINTLIQKHGQISETQMQEVYDQHLSRSRLSERIEEVGADFQKEFDQIMGLLDTARESTGEYGQSLKTAATSLAGASGNEQVQTIVRTLLASTKQMEKRAQDLESKLSESKQQIEVLHENLEAVRHENMTDALTGIANRKHFDHAMIKALSSAKHNGEPFSLLLGDIDHFKVFNDTFGHQTGDQVLRLVAHALRTNVKGRDLPARYGGEEFAIILPQTSLESAVTVANHIREAIMAKELIKKSTGESLGTITMSFGAASYAEGDTIDSIIARADTCLYAAKNAGRNMVKSEDDPGIDMILNVA